MLDVTQCWRFRRTYLVAISLLLPPANEVWGKVIFLHLFVILFTGGVCVVAPGGHVWLLPGGGVHGYSGGACVVAPRGHVWLLLGGACMVAPRGTCVVAPGGACVVAPRGACMVAPGWACVVAPGGACVVAPGGGGVMRYEIQRYDQWAGGTHPTGMHSCV